MNAVKLRYFAPGFLAVLVIFSNVANSQLPRCQKIKPKNCRTSKVFTADELPDLAITRFQCQPVKMTLPNGKQVDRWRIRVMVQNCGSRPAREILVSLSSGIRPGEDAELKWSRITDGWTVISQLDPGKKKELEWHADAETITALGIPRIPKSAKRLKVEVDYANTVHESDENNNASTLNLSGNCA